MFLCCCANDDGKPIEEAKAIGTLERMTVRPQEESREAPAKDSPRPPQAAELEAKEEKAKMVDPPAPAPEPVKAEEIGATEQSEAYYYEVEIVKGTGGLGMKMDFKDSGLNVAEIVTGASVDKHNASASPQHIVAVGDYICEVNDKADTSQVMVGKLKAEKVLKLRMFRPATFHIKLQKDGSPLGLDLKFQQDSTSLDVKAISKGIAEDYNATAPPELQIRVQDVIKSVNGNTLDVKKMIDELKTATQLDLVMFRGPA
mmetsp:Transcript_133460/g.333153  ORF Transcript_133460/g.333153 Transcript_133460/m.333153 type:complete len:258 (+) Transcript_133460:80-853(+)